MHSIKKADVTLDIDKGDTLLGGRFKNKPTVVEDIATDELGQPTVNGKKLLAMRIKKLLPTPEPTKQAGADSAPNYSPASDQDAKCASCVHSKDGYCTLYDFTTDSEYTCDSFSINFNATTTTGVPQILEKYLPDKVAGSYYEQGFIAKCAEAGVAEKNKSEGWLSALKDLGLSSGTSAAMGLPALTLIPLGTAVENRYASKIDREALRKAMNATDVPIGDLAGGGHNAFYDFTNKRVMLGDKVRNSASVLAHELGHSQQAFKAIAPIVIASKLAPLAGLASLFTNDKETSQTLNNANSLMLAPLVAAEIDASRRGYKALRALGRGRLGAAGAFTGVPTYLGLALAPQLFQKGREHFGTVTELNGESKNMKQAQALQHQPTKPTGGAAPPPVTGNNLNNSFKNIAQQGVRNGAAVAVGVKKPNAPSSMSIPYGVNSGGTPYGVNAMSPEMMQQPQKSAQYQQQGYNPMDGVQQRIQEYQNRLASARGALQRSAYDQYGIMQQQAQQQAEGQWRAQQQGQAQLQHYAGEQGKQASYLTGFFEKCAAYGVDAVLMNNIRHEIEKKAALEGRQLTPDELSEIIQRAQKANPYFSGLSGGYIPFEDDAAMGKYRKGALDSVENMFPSKYKDVTWEQISPERKKELQSIIRKKFKLKPVINFKSNLRDYANVHEEVGGKGLPWRRAEIASDLASRKVLTQGQASKYLTSARGDISASRAEKARLEQALPPKVQNLPSFDREALSNSNKRNNGVYEAIVGKLKQVASEQLKGKKQLPAVRNTGVATSKALPAVIPKALPAVIPKALPKSFNLKKLLPLLGVAGISGLMGYNANNDDDEDERS